MYDLLALRRKISKEGLTETLIFLTSESLSPTVKAQLEEAKILNNGYPCLSLLLANS